MCKKSKSILKQFLYFAVKESCILLFYAPIYIIFNLEKHIENKHKFYLKHIWERKKK